MYKILKNQINIISCSLSVMNTKIITMYYDSETALLIMSALRITMH